MNNLAPMKNCPGGVQGNLNWMPGYSHHLMIVPAPPMHQYDDTPMMVSVLYWKKKKKKKKKKVRVDQKWVRVD